jgi:group I intron endonuclease
MGFIYVIENIIDNKKYVGQTIRDIKIRWSEHLSCKKNVPLYNAIKKHGKDSFRIIYTNEYDNKLLDFKEIILIKEHNSLIPYGYNVHKGGNNENLSRYNSRKGGINESGHDKQSLVVKHKYKNIPELKNITDVPRGISFKKQNKYKSTITYFFIVRKKGVKTKEFSTSKIDNIQNIFEKATSYLNEQSKLICSTGVGR